MIIYKRIIVFIKEKNKEIVYELWMYHDPFLISTTDPD